MADSAFERFANHRDSDLQVTFFYEAVRPNAIYQVVFLDDVPAAFDKQQ